MGIEHHSIRLLTILFDNPETTMDELAKKLDVSSRTIQRYITDLQDILKDLSFDLEIIIHPSKGVKLVGDYKRYAVIIQKLNRLSVNEERDRLWFIISTMMNATEPITIQSFADRMHIGRSTVEKSLSKAREFLVDFDVEVSGTNKGLTIQTTEVNKRKILSELIRQYWHGVSVDLDDRVTKPLNISLNNQLAPLIHQSVIEDVQSLIDTFIRDNSVSITEYQYQSLIIHIAIAIDRIRKDFIVRATNNNEHLNPLTIQLIEAIEARFKIIIPSDEMQYLDIHIEGLNNHSNPLKAVSDIRTLEYGYEIQQLLEDTLGYLEPDTSLINGLSVHLNTSIKRLKKNITIKNPYKDQIKEKYSTAFNLAVELAVDLSSRFDVVFSVDEMTYIAIHLQSFFERQNDQKLEVFLVCASGYGTVKLLEQRIIQHFGDQLTITDTIGITRLRELDFANKLIISTIPIDSPLDNIICVSPLLSDIDIQNIGDYIQRQQKQLPSALGELLDPELIFYSQGLNENWMTVMEFLVGQLIYRSYAEVGLLESVIDRERLSSTALNTFSMPHGDVKYIKKSVLSVYVNPHGIQWGRQRVTSVFFFAMNPKEELRINEVYKDFNNLISDELWMDQLVEVNDREELIKFLMNERNEINE